MASPRSITRPLACLKSSLRQARLQKQQKYRRYHLDVSRVERFRRPIPEPETSEDAHKPIEHKKIPIYPPPPSAAKACREPLNTFRDIQIKQLDPTGARTRLFSRANPEAARPGDILLVRPRSGDPFAGVCLSIRRRGIDTAILLRNQLTRVGVEMWYKVYSPNVQAIEVVQRRERRARRERLYYMRLPKHDAGSVEGIVTAYERRRRLMGLGGALQTTSTGGAKGGEAHVRQRKTKDRNKR